MGSTMNTVFNDLVLATSSPPRIRPGRILRYDLGNGKEVIMPRKRYTTEQIISIKAIEDYYHLGNGTDDRKPPYADNVVITLLATCTARRGFRIARFAISPNE